jgi:hypothetical protein
MLGLGEMELEAAPSGGASQEHACLYREAALSEGACEGRINSCEWGTLQDD